MIVKSLQTSLKSSNTHSAAMTETCQQTYDPKNRPKNGLHRLGEIFTSFRNGLQPESLSASKIDCFHDFDGEPGPAALELSPADLQSFPADSAEPPLSRNPGFKVLNKGNTHQNTR